MLHELYSCFVAAVLFALLLILVHHQQCLVR